MGDQRPGPNKCKEDVVVNKNNDMWYGCGNEMKKEEMNVMNTVNKTYIQNVA